MRIAIAAGLFCTALFFTSPLTALPSPVKQQEAAALSGNITAQIKLADGYLARKETVQAEYWFRKAAEQNNPYAQNALGKLLLLTDESPDVLMQAKAWFEKAATQQYAPAQTNLGNVYLHLADLNDKKNNNIVYARYWFEKAARQNVAVAQFQLGMMYLHAWGVKQDISQAKTWFEKAAAQDQPDALYQLGVMYYGGKGCEGNNCAIARHFYEKAALQSHGAAQFYLSMMYLQGHGVAQDYDKGVSLMQASCDNGEPEACPWAKNLTEDSDKFRQIFSLK